MLPAPLVHQVEGTLRLEPLCRIRFTYPESWVVGLEGGWDQHLFLAEGLCEGSISRRFRGANFPHRRTATGPNRPDFRAAIETDDGATIRFELTGYGRVYPPDGDRSSAPAFISATATAAAGSMMLCASVWERCACRAIPIGKTPTS
jgi:hypothetical protein